jgi:hypothetical protein
VSENLLEDTSQETHVVDLTTEIAKNETSKKATQKLENTSKKTKD